MRSRRYLTTMASSSISLIMVLAIIFLSSSSFTAVRCQRQTGSSDVTRTLPCMELLMRCQNHMSDPAPITQVCCSPLKYVIANNPQCLCSLAISDDFLNYLNVSFADALTLPSRCGLEPVDPSRCTFDQPNPAINFDNTDGSPPASHAGPSNYDVGFRTILTSAVAMLLVISRVPYFRNVF